MTRYELYVYIESELDSIEQRVKTAKDTMYALRRDEQRPSGCGSMMAEPPQIALYRVQASVDCCETLLRQLKVPLDSPHAEPCA